MSESFWFLGDAVCKEFDWSLREQFLLQHLRGEVIGHLVFVILKKREIVKDFILVLITTKGMS